VLRLELTRCLENAATHGGRALACARPIQWQGQWRRVDAVAAELRHEPPERVRPVRVRCRNGETKAFGACTNVLRLKRYGRKRLGIVHANEALREVLRLLLTEALPGESGRVLETWR
jgi:hypothetical protein